MGARHPQQSPSSGDPLLCLLALVAESTSAEGIAKVLAQATTLVGAERISLSADAPSPALTGSELRIPIYATSQYVVAVFAEAPDRLEVERLRLLASSLSLALRLTEREREMERSRYHVTLGRVLAGVVHDLATPLNTLLLSVDAARNGIDVDDAFADALASGRLMHAGLDRLRRFTGSLSSKQSAIDVGDAVACALRVATFETSERAEVAVRVSPGLFVRARVGEMEHVLLNLIINAAHALDGLGGYHHRITVSAFARGTDVVVEVQDTGPGVAPEDLHRLFDDGFTTKAWRHGLGMGLSVCREIITTLGGTIEISAPPGQGTRVIVRVPAASKDEEHGALLVNSPHGVPTLPRVLIVDADPLVTRALKRALSRIAAVTTTTDPEHAMALIAETAFHVILCEHVPPHADARALRRAHAARWPEHAGQFILTIVDPAPDLEAGTRVMTKPLDINVLKALVPKNS